MDVTPFAGGLLVGILIGIGATAGGALAVWGIVARGTPVTGPADTALCDDPEPTPERGPMTHYPPYSTHRDLVPTEWPDGTVTYHAGAPQPPSEDWWIR